MNKRPKAHQLLEVGDEIELVIPKRLPSWNDVLDMDHWQRIPFKREIQGDTLLALKATGKGFSIKITCARSITLIRSATLDLSQKIIQTSSTLKCPKPKFPKSLTKKLGLSSKGLNNLNAVKRIQNKRRS